MSKCAGCSASNPDEARFCGQCGRAMDPPPATSAAVATIVPAPGRAAAGPPAAEQLPAAPRVRRLVAGAIDLAIGGVFLLPFAAMPIWMEPFMKAGFFAKIVRFVPALYLLLRDSIGGRSVGKTFMGLVTYDRNERRPANVIDSVVRNWPLVFPLLPWFGWMISAFFSALMALQILFGARQRFGDGFATTQVLDEKCLEPAGAPARGVPTT